MEATLKELEDGGIRVLANPAVEDDEAAFRDAAEKSGLAGHCIFRTSGSTGNPKYVCLTREALVSSALAVNNFLSCGENDVWLNALPDFHVGGFGAKLRAYLAGGREIVHEAKWNAADFVSGCVSSGATMTSLVPAQLHDLAKGGHACPSSMRVVLVGGGWVANDLWARLRYLGWPVRMTYGMTEACSQVATDPGDGRMQVLPIWDTRTDETGRLAIRGSALMSGYLVRDEDGSIEFENPSDADGWFATRDLVKLKGDRLEFMGRVDRMVKVLGELVDLDALEEKGRGLGEEESLEFAIVETPDERRGYRLTGVFEEEEARANEIFERFNREVAGFERLEDWVSVRGIPRTPLGKVDRTSLRKMITSS